MTTSEDYVAVNTVSEEYLNKDCRTCKYSEGTEKTLFRFCSKRGASFPLTYVCSRYISKENDSNGQ